MSTDLNQYFAEFTNKNTGKIHSTFCLGETFEDAEKAWGIRYGDHNTLDSLTLTGVWNTDSANLKARTLFQSFKRRNPA